MMKEIDPEEGHPQDLIVLKRCELVAGYTYLVEEVIPHKAEEDYRKSTKWVLEFDGSEGEQE